jgi:hypothetical protein
MIPSADYAAMGPAAVDGQGLWLVGSRFFARIRIQEGRHRRIERRACLRVVPAVCFVLEERLY